MVKIFEYIGIQILVDEEEDLLQPEDQMALISILEKSEMMEMTMKPNDDGSFTYNFRYRIPRADIIKLKNHNADS